MNDPQTLLVVLVALYLGECCAWLRFGSVAICGNMFGRGRVVHPSPLLGNESGGLAFFNPLPLFGSVFICHAWPLTVTADLVYSYVSQTINPGKRPQRVTSYVDWEDVKRVDAVGGAIRVDGNTLIDPGNAAAAGRFSSLLNQLARAERAVRDDLIEAELRESFNVEAVRGLMERFREESGLLRFLCQFLFVILLIVLPWTVVTHQFSRWAPGLLVSAGACWAAILVCFYQVHRSLLPADRAARRTAIVKMLVMPTAAIRACDRVSRDLFIRYDPLAVAAVACGRETFAAVARRTVRDLRFPARPICPALNIEMVRAEASFRHRLEEHLHALLRQMGFDPAQLLAVPDATDPAHQSYCPRCEAQYIIPEGYCHDCGGRPLEALGHGVHASELANQHL